MEFHAQRYKKRTKFSKGWISLKLKLKGTALKTGFNSHFVVTNHKGESITKQTDDSPIFDEIVISQESQIAPAFIFFVEPEDLKGAAARWNVDKSRS